MFKNVKNWRTVKSCVFRIPSKMRITTGDSCSKTSPNQFFFDIQNKYLCFSTVNILEYFRLSDVFQYLSELQDFKFVLHLRRLK